MLEKPSGYQRGQSLHSLRLKHSLRTCSLAVGERYIHLTNAEGDFKITTKQSDVIESDKGDSIEQGVKGRPL